MFIQISVRFLLAMAIVLTIVGQAMRPCAGSEQVRPDAAAAVWSGPRAVVWAQAVEQENRRGPQQKFTVEEAVRGYRANAACLIRPAPTRRATVLYCRSFPDVSGRHQPPTSLKAAGRNSPRQREFRVHIGGDAP